MKIQPPTKDAIRQAAEAIRRGELIAMPTETVYGLAADALNPDAVRKTFAAKGRPADNPLIVHLSDLGDVEFVAREFPPLARKLAEAFWPGPLTLILPKRREVPQEVSAGLDSVGVRVPSHPVALALIRASGRPISAPSANPFMALSPTRADHLDPRILERVALVLDGGPCEVGLESTVVDVRGPEVIVLRPGRISVEDLEAIVGPVSIADSSETKGAKLAPGQYRRHYAPNTPVRLVDRLGPNDKGIALGVATGEDQIVLPDDPVAFGASLYASLHELDRLGLEEILIQSPPHRPEWVAVWDRLRRAATSAED